MIYKMILLLSLTLLISGCFRTPSSLKIKIWDTTQEEYNQITNDVKSIVTQLDSAFDCDSDNETWGGNRVDGNLLCQNGEFHTKFKNNTTSITLVTTSGFFIPTKEKVSSFHKKMRKLFIQMAKKYKKKYSNSTVNVIFYHKDISKDGRIIYGKNND